MTALRARLDPKVVRSSSRTAHRRALHLPTEGITISGTSDVLIRDLSTTGLLLETSGDLSESETIGLGIIEGRTVNAVVKWSSGRLFGCQFQEPISTAAVSSILLRASYEPRSNSATIAPEIRPSADHQTDDCPRRDELSFGVKLRWIFGLVLLSWVIIIAGVSIVWINLR